MIKMVRQAIFLIIFNFFAEIFGNFFYESIYIPFPLRIKPDQIKNGGISTAVFL
ncbi:MAG: hypothetical protein HFE27_06220 [Clostridia bacterium]|nr:hypothetical protein [Clostridia bacterium]